MGSEWAQVQLQDIVTILGDGLHGTPTYDLLGEYYFINGNNLENGKVVFKETTKRVSYDQFLKHKKDLNERTLLVSINGTLGNIAYYGGENVVLGKSACYFNLKPEINIEFIRYVLAGCHFQHYIQQQATGTTIKNVSLRTMREYSFRLPPREHQDFLAEILSKLDQKIDLNRQMNTTLESMAQALFKSWFVDFDPVIDKALAAGNPIPEPLHARAEARKALGDQRKPLPASIQQQFPDRFVFTEEMGWVPEGWEIVPLVEFGRIVCGKTPSKSKSEHFGEDTPFIKIPDMHTSMFVVDPIEKLSELGVASQAKKSIPRGSVCVSCIATVGKVVIASTESQTNQQINSVVPRAEYLTPYLYFYMLSLERLFHDLASGGSATLNMNTSTFSRVRVLKPSEDLLGLFGDSVQSQFLKIEINQKESMTLTRLRDTLLPKLLSGELRVPEG